MAKKIRVTKKDSKKQKQLLEKKLDVEWSKYIRNRDKNCQKCGTTHCLGAHHVFGRRHIATRWDVNNGICLCGACHLWWAHRDVGGFIEWFIEKVGEEKYTKLALEHNKIVKYDNECLETMLDWFWKESNNV